MKCREVGVSCNVNKKEEKCPENPRMEPRWKHEDINDGRPCPVAAFALLPFPTSAAPSNPTHPSPHRGV